MTHLNPRRGTGPQKPLQQSSQTSHSCMKLWQHVVPSLHPWPSAQQVPLQHF
jgi:hypothetical protein